MSSMAFRADARWTTRTLQHLYNQRGGASPPLLFSRLCAYISTNKRHARNAWERQVQNGFRTFQNVIVLQDR